MKSLAHIPLTVVALGAMGNAPPSTQSTPSFQLAREHVLNGDYDQAVRLYDDLAKEPRGAVRAACDRVEIDHQRGTYTQGIARLIVFEDQGRLSADWHACLASLVVEVDRYEEALQCNRRALEIDGTHIRARLQLGLLYETVGRPLDAIRVYQPFDDVMTGGDLPKTAEDLTRLGRGFLRFTVLTNNTNLVRRTRHVLQEIYQEAFHYVDASYWPARLAAAELLLEKHSLDEAKKDFEEICKQNPRVPAAHVGLGRIALVLWRLEEAEQRAEAALKINPNCVAAHLLLANTQLAERRYRDAAASARRALDTNPNSIQALGALAAAQWRGGDMAASQRTQDSVARINPRPAVMHHILGVWLSAGRQFSDARRHFEKAIEFAPTWPAPHMELGLLFMETGEEALARQRLETAFKLDSFNSRTFNLLDLLDSLEKFARLTTEHFVIKYDEKQDAIVAPYLAEALEDMYDEVCDETCDRPAQRTIVELFPDHLGFSVRVTARPFIATVGACTGRVIALSAPRPESPFGRYNWKTVLRHEFAHTVTLGATKNRIPHWMTEGLAVYEEPAPRSWDAKRLLSTAIQRDRLFSLESIDWAFIRPRRPEDRGQAYAQSEWMIEYIIDRHGIQAIRKLLEAFRDGASQSAVFKRVLNTEPEDFDDAFKSWAMAEAEQWNMPITPIVDPDEIKKQLEGRPDDAALLAQLAQAELLDHDPDAAEQSARQALKKDRDQILALEILSHVLIIRMLREKEEATRQDLIDQAEPYVRRLYDLSPENPSAIKYLGYIEQAWHQWREAIRYLARYQQRFPEDPDPYRRLAAIHLRRKDPTSALRQLEVLARLVDDDAPVARQIASIYRQQGQLDKAVRWYRRVIEIDPYDVDTHGALADALLRTRAFAAAEREYKVVCKLIPEEAIGYDGLSRLHKAMGNQEQAAAYKKQAAALRGEQEDDDSEE